MMLPVVMNSNFINLVSMVLLNCVIAEYYLFLLSRKHSWTFGGRKVRACPSLKIEYWYALKSVLN